MEQVDNFQVLAEEIISVCGDYFEKAIMDGKVDENYMDHRIICIDSDGNENLKLLKINKTEIVFDALYSIRENMSSNGEEKWTSYKFEINKSGALKFNVSYDNE